MSNFLYYIFPKYTVAKMLLATTIIILILNGILYIYWLYYISSYFQIHTNTIHSINYYTDTMYVIDNPLPTLEINISLFELQSTMLYIIIWTLFIISPYVYTIIIIYKKNYPNIKTYNIVSITRLYIIILIVQSIYIPSLINILAEYYNIYQFTYESFHLNIEYNAKLIIKYILIYYTGLYILLIITHFPRMIIYFSYLLVWSLDQPIVLALISYCITIIIIEILIFLQLAATNYLTKTATLCLSMENDIR